MLKNKGIAGIFILLFPFFCAYFLISYLVYILYLSLQGTMLAGIEMG